MMLLLRRGLGSLVRPVAWTHRRFFASATPRRLQDSAGPSHTGAESSGLDDVLDEMEALLLGEQMDSAIVDTTDQFMSPESSVGTVGGASSSAASNTTVDAVECFDSEQTVARIEAVLPASGAVPLSHVTACVDMEAVARLHGSLLRFLRGYSPHRIVVAQAVDGRWAVRRPSSEAAAVLPGEPGLGQQQLLATKNQKRAVTLRPVWPSNMEDLAASIVQAVVAFLQGPGRPDPRRELCREVLRALPRATQQAVRENFLSLPRMVKAFPSVAAALLDVTTDSSWIGLKGTLDGLSVGVYKPKGAGGTLFPPLPVPAESGYAEDAWLVEIDVDLAGPAEAATGMALNSPSGLLSESERHQLAECDEDGDGLLSVGKNSDDGAAAPDLFTLASIPPPPDAPLGIAIPPAPAPPLITPPRLASKSKATVAASTSSSPPSLEAKQHELAVRKGWRTPGEMLDMFVDVVPTFHVPISRLCTTAPLLKVLGPRHTLAKLIKIYCYFFDIDHAVQSVKLRSGLKHPRAGVADKLYSLKEADAEVAAPATRMLKPSGVTKHFPVVEAMPKVAPATTASASPTGSATPVSPVDPVGRAVQDDVLAFLVRHGSSVSCAQWCPISSLGATGIPQTVELLQRHKRWFMLRGGSAALPWEFRLRPFWIAPNSTADFTVREPSSAALRPLLVAMQAKMKPVWQLVSKISASLPADAAAVLKDFAAERRRKNVGGAKDDCSEVLVDVMRLHGGSFWVESETGGRARLLTGSSSLDDEVNEMPFQALRDALLRAKGVDFVALRTAATELLPPALGNQFLSSATQPEEGENAQVPGFRWRRDEEVVAAIQDRVRDFDTRLDGGILMVGKHSPFRKSPSPQSQKPKLPQQVAAAAQTSSWAKFCR